MGEARKDDGDGEKTAGSIAESLVFLLNRVPMNEEEEIRFAREIEEIKPQILEVGADDVVSYLLHNIKQTKQGFSGEMGQWIGACQKKVTQHSDRDNVGYGFSEMRQGLNNLFQRQAGKMMSLERALGFVRGFTSELKG